MKIGVVLFPSKQVQDFANSYRKRYDTKYALISPHVTIMERTEIDEADLPKVLEYLQQVADSTKPVQLKIDGVRSFAPTNNVLYLKVLPTRELSALHDIRVSAAYHHRSRLDRCRTVRRARTDANGTSAFRGDDQSHGRHV